MNVANFRFTVGNEIMKGNYPGYSSLGTFYNPITKTFTKKFKRNTCNTKRQEYYFY